MSIPTLPGSQDFEPDQKMVKEETNSVLCDMIDTQALVASICCMLAFLWSLKSA